MGHFFNPPQPFVGGRQPSAPLFGVPQAPAVVDNPPNAAFGSLAALLQIVTTWQPDPWQYSGFGARQPYMARQISPGVPRQSVDEPPYQLGGPYALKAEAVAIAQPDPWTYTFLGRMQPFDSRKLKPPSVDEPPYQQGGPIAIKSQLIGQQQPDPWTYAFVGGSAPFLPRPVNAGIPGRDVDQPPYTLGGPIAMKALASLIAVTDWGYSAWPYVFMGDRQPYQGRTSYIGAVGVQVNEPPYTYGGPTFQIQLAAQIAQPDPWTYNFNGSAQPYSRRQLAGGLNRQPVDEPPYTLGGPIALKMEAVSITQPDPWTYAFMGQLQPFGKRTLSPGIPGQSKDPPPFTNAGPLAIKLQQAAFSAPDWNGAAWPYLFIGRTQPYAPRIVPPATAAVVANNPPFGHRARTAAMQAVMRAWDPPPYDFQMRMYASKQLLFEGTLRRPTARGYIIL